VIPADWLEYMAKAEKEISQRPPDAPGRPRAIKKQTSNRQRIALSQTRNTIKAMFQSESQWNQTPIRSDTKGLTLNVGGSCEPDSPHGKSTQSRS